MVTHGSPYGSDIAGGKPEDVRQKLDALGQDVGWFGEVREPVVDGDASGLDALEDRVLILTPGPRSSR